MFEFWNLDNSLSKSILDVLETIYLKFRKPVVQRFTVVKFGVYNGGGNCFCGVKVKVGTDTAESTNVMIAGFRQCRVKCLFHILYRVAQKSKPLSSVIIKSY